MIYLYSVKQVSKLTCSSYFPFSAFIDVNIIFQVDLYPAAVSLVVENDLLTRQAHLREGKLFSGRSTEIIIKLGPRANI